MPEPQELNTNEERLEYVKDQLVIMAQLEYAYGKGQVKVAGEVIEITPQVKASMKQKLVEARTNCITVLNQVQF